MLGPKLMPRSVRCAAGYGPRPFGGRIPRTPSFLTFSKGGCPTGWDAGHAGSMSSTRSRSETKRETYNVISHMHRN
jgi:hypothetical protein